MKHTCNLLVSATFYLTHGFNESMVKSEDSNTHKTSKKGGRSC